MSEIRMGKLPDSWKEGMAKSITFCVTEDCNLACKYCYMTGKNSKNRLNFEVAKKAVDFFLSRREEFPEEAVVWDFIGGEPFIEIDLIDQISDYIKQQMFLLDHPWFNSYRFSFSTNGLLYNTPKVQEYIHKNRGHINIGISVDGNKIKHDLQRVKPDGSGSYEDVVKSVPLWLEQFPNASTKATFSHDDLPHLKDSIISLWNLGIKTVAANVVFENVWEEGDDVIFESQLKELADHIIENKLWGEYSVRFFDPKTGHPLREEEKEQNFCGAGKMIAVDCHGNLYPCIRFYQFSLNNREAVRIGDIEKGVNSDRVRPFLGLTLRSQSKKECADCEMATGCAWCQGCNYDLADTDTIYQRATYQCKMHKANVRANKYFWSRFAETTGMESEWEKQEIAISQGQPGGNPGIKYLQIITSDNIVPHCSYRNTRSTNEIMSSEVYHKGLEFARKNGFKAVMLGSPGEHAKEASHLITVQKAADVPGDNTIAIYDNETCGNNSGNCILRIDKKNIEKISAYLQELYNTAERVNLILEDIENWGNEELEKYKLQLDNLVRMLAERYRSNKPVELNVLTDIWDMQGMRNCQAGTSSFALAPNGKIYLCPAFYFDDPESYVGTLESGIEIKNAYLLELKNAPICSNCDVYNCSRCKYLNKKLTGEFNTPSKVQCIISHIERNKSMELQKLLQKEIHAEFDNLLEEIDYLDPLEKILKIEKRSVTSA